MRPSSGARRSLTRGGLSQRRHRPDYWILIIASMLLVIGLIVVYSISPGLAVQLPNAGENYFVVRQLSAILIGVAAFIVASFVPIARWRQWQKPLIVAAALTAVAVRLFGEEIYGAYRWLTIGGLSFQAVELIKFALLIWLAAFLADRKQQNELTNKDKTIKPLLYVLGLVGFVVAVVQSDLGSAVVLVAMMVVMSFVAGLPMKKILMIGGIIGIGVILAISSTAYRRDRFATFLNPERDCQAAGYQACQALVAVGSGGMFGRGLAQSVQAYGYLPQAADDSIFAVYAEKFGFIGSVVLLGLFLTLFNRLKRVVERAPDNFSQLLVVGILTWLSVQALINIGAMIGLLPLKGITLPFISYGGTSIIFVTMAVGIVFQVSRYTTLGAASHQLEGRGFGENSAHRRGNRRPYYANSRPGTRT